MVESLGLFCLNFTRITYSGWWNGMDSLEWKHGDCVLSMLASSDGKCSKPTLARISGDGDNGQWWAFYATEEGEHFHGISRMLAIRETVQWLRILLSDI